MKKAITYQYYQKRVKRAYLSIANSLEQPIDTALLAKESAFSFYHFHRIYRAIVGETVIETHRRLRLERAAERLIHSHFSIIRIALEAGYNTPQAFSRAFKSRFIYSPSEYRKKRPVHDNDCCRFKSFLTYSTDFMEIINMSVTIEKRSPTVVFALRHVGPYPEISKAFNELWQWATSANLITQAKSGICIYYDDPSVTPPSQCRADACIEFTEPYPQETGSVRQIEIPAGTYARYRHIGPYRTLEQAYAIFCGQWLPNSGYELADAPPFEEYINSPHDTPEDQLITDIYLQVIDK